MGGKSPQLINSQLSTNQGEKVLPPLKKQPKKALVNPDFDDSQMMVNLASIGHAKRMPPGL